MPPQQQPRRYGDGVNEPNAPGELPGGTRLVHFETCGSTNAEAMRLALASDPGRGGPLPFWVVADRQTAGKGRSGRTWLSTASGNLYASFAFAPTCPIARAAELSLVAGVAVVEAVHLVAPGVPARLKWPNDIMVAGAKLGGILVESTVASGRLVAVIGIGLNLVSAPEVAGRPTTALAAHLSGTESPPTALEMLAFLAEAMHDWLPRWEAGFAAVRAAWLNSAGARGERLSVNAGSGPVEGAFAGLDEDGALLLEIGTGETRRFTFGDVTLVATGEDRRARS